MNDAGLNRVDAWAEVGRARKHESAELHVRGQATYTDDIAELKGISLEQKFRDQARSWFSKYLRK
ncbi:MAG: hypothetical protein K6T61_11145, partial [Bryobacteraceae bacterium]|nr:hypothetical protein [Bryobacteraceae bacterium]